VTLQECAIDVPGGPGYDASALSGTAYKFQIYKKFTMDNEASSQKLTFSAFNLVEPLNKAIADLGFTYCTPIQAQSLHFTLQGNDVTGRAQTGTGKTAAFLITIINDLVSNPIEETRYIGEPRALIIAPTRELVMQIASDAQHLCKYTDLHIVTMVGGEDYQKQLRAVDRRPVDIVVADTGPPDRLRAE